MAFLPECEHGSKNITYSNSQLQQCVGEPREKQVTLSHQSQLIISIYAQARDCSQLQNIWLQSFLAVLYEVKISNTAMQN